MKTCTTLILAATMLVSLALADPDPLHSATQVFLLESVPKIELKDATFEEAVAELESKWKVQFPKLDFPIAAIRYKKVEGYQGSSKGSITLTLKDAPYRDVFRYIAELSGHRVISIRDLEVAEEAVWIEEDWRTCATEVSESVLEFLKISKGMSADAVTARVKAVGIKFPYETTARLSTDGTILGMTNVPKENEKLLGMIHLLNEGYTIKRAEQGGARQPATAPDSKSEGNEKPKPETERRSQ